jgi:hypothetical protein
MGITTPSRVRTLAVATAVTAALAAGCGSAGSSSQDSSSPAAAVPSGALFYADINLDQSSDAWKQFSAVGQRFPGWQRLVDRFLQGFDDQSGSDTDFASVSPAGITFQHDVEPWLGDSAGFAVTSLDTSGGDPNYVLVVDSRDDAKAKDALTGSGGTADGSYRGYDQFRDAGSGDEAAVGQGTVLIASNEQTLHDAIDTRDGKGDSLADDGRFGDAMAALPAESLVRGYVNTQKIAQLAGFAALGSLGDAGGAQQFQQLGKSLQSLDSASFAMWANDGGYRFTARTTFADGADRGLLGENLKPSTLTGLVPDDAFAYLAFSGYGKMLQDNLGQAGMQQQLRLLEAETGLSLQRDVLPLLSGEDLLYAAPGVPIRGALLLKPDDPAAAARAMHRLTAVLARMSPEVVVQPLDGGDGQKLTYENGLAFTWRLTADGLIAIGNDQMAGSQPSSPLSTSDAFAQVLSKAGVPSDANVPVYLNVAGLLKLFPVQVDPNLQHVGAVLAWTSTSDNGASFDLFAEVR